MNATLELDEDVARYLQGVMRQSGRSLTEVVNLLLRGSFEARGGIRAPAEPRPFMVAARPMGVRQELDYNRIADLLEHLEGPDYR